MCHWPKIVNMRKILATIVLCSGMMVLSYPCAFLAAQISSAEPSICNVNRLPTEIQDRIRADFGSWRVQEPEDLSHQARLSWAGKKSSGCPGIAVGFFRGSKETSYAAYAVLLVPSDHPDAAYRFVVFSRQSENSAYEELVLEKADVRGASNFFIQRVSVSEFFDEASKKTFQVQASEAILIVDSADDEYEADIHFWSKDRFRQEPVDH